MLGRGEVVVLLLRGDGSRGLGPRRALAAMARVLAAGTRRAARAGRRAAAAAGSLLAFLALAAGYAIAGTTLVLRFKIHPKLRRRAIGGEEV